MIDKTQPAGKDIWDKILVDKVGDDILMVKDPDDECPPCYGITEFDISIKDIAALLSGKKLYGTVNDNEYAFVIRFKHEEDK